MVLKLSEWDPIWKKKLDSIFSLFTLLSSLWYKAHMGSNFVLLIRSGI